jgi:hypothetical protein
MCVQFWSALLQHLHEQQEQREFTQEVKPHPTHITWNLSARKEKFANVLLSHA